MMEPLVGSFGYLATKLNAIKVSLGQFEAPKGTDPYALDLIEACKIPESIRYDNKISLEVTPDENQKGWKRMKQKTALANSTYLLSFAHY